MIVITNLIILSAFVTCLAGNFYASQLAEQDKKKDQIASAEQIKEALERQMESHREQHQRQLAELRREISDKQTVIVELNE